MQFEVVSEDKATIDFSVGFVHFVDAEGYSIIQKDFRVRGDVWRVHKYDADPFPSSPHAHCIEGRAFYKGGKMHLGTGELYKGGAATGYRYPPKDFLALCERLGKKFPDIILPLQGQD